MAGLIRGRATDLGGRILLIFGRILITTGSLPIRWLRVRAQSRSRLVNNRMRFIVAVVSLMTICCVKAQPVAGPTSAPASMTTAPAAPATSLAELYKNDFLIGVAIDFNDNTPLTPQELSIIKTQFNVITPENSMKPQAIHPEEDQWNWDKADKLVNFCQGNGIQTIGHTLVWHGQTGRWFFEGENGQPVTREKAIERLKQHIYTEVGRYKGKIKGWDVVNEAINESGPGDTENLRNSSWFRAIGPDYINYAFKFAHEADPNAELYYNDFSIEKGNKHANSLLLLKRLIAQGVPITAVGIQGHWSLNDLPYNELNQAIDDYKALGLKVNITELDVTISGQGGGQLTPTTGPATRPTTRPGRRRGFGGGFNFGPIIPPTKEQLDAQARAYAKFFDIFQKHKDVIERVTIWGLNDARSWRPGQAPLLFDGNNQPKPAFAAVVAAKK
jgi:GH35 family endo-1,4-beta-xylanase